MLTGGWADYNGIDDNGQTKDPDVKTFLTKIAETGRAVSFTTSWREHTSTSYQPDIVSAIETGLPAEYTHQIDDAATYYQVLSYVAKPQGAEKTAQEDWLIIISTDHGGTGTSHGGQTPFERMTWLACNKTVELSEENKTFALTK